MLSIEKSIKIGVGRGKREIFDTFPLKKDYFNSILNIGKEASGKGVKIAILDTGCPSHKDISIDAQSSSFCKDDIVDKIGHSTMVSGIIKAKGEMEGIAPNAKIYYGKIMKNNNVASFNALLAGTIWAITKEVDIIVMAIGTDYNYNIFYSAIEKAVECGICVFSPSGRNVIKETDNILYPAKYNNVFSTSFLSKSIKQNKILKDKVDFCCPNINICTTYKDNKYININGSSFSTAILAGIAANFIELYKKEKVKKTDIPLLLKKDIDNKLKFLKRGMSGGE